MSVVNTRLNKNVVRWGEDRLQKIRGFGRTHAANDTIAKVILLRDIVCVGDLFAAVANYEVNKRANRMLPLSLNINTTRVSNARCLLVRPHCDAKHAMEKGPSMATCRQWHVGHGLVAL